MASRGTSVRLSPRLRERLEAASRHIGKDPEWIVTRAIGEYLESAYPEALVDEAKRQSLIAAGSRTKDELYWESLRDSKS